MRFKISESWFEKTKTWTLDWFLLSLVFDIFAMQMYIERREEQNKREIAGVDFVKMRSWQGNWFVLSTLS